MGAKCEWRRSARAEMQLNKGVKKTKNGIEARICDGIARIEITTMIRDKIQLERKKKKDLTFRSLPSALILLQSSFLQPPCSSAPNFFHGRYFSAAGVETKTYLRYLFRNSAIGVIIPSAPPTFIEQCALQCESAAQVACKHYMAPSRVTRCLFFISQTESDTSGGSRSSAQWVSEAVAVAGQVG